MPLSHPNERFFSTTRGRLIVLLRRAGRTVEELAQSLGLTDNAIRAHLATLERDGLVRQSGERRTGSKPAAIYELTAQAEQLFPQPYDLVLSHLLDALAESATLQQREALMRAAGRRLAEQWHISDGDSQLRLRQAVEALDQLGGLAGLEQGEEASTIQGYSCPFAAVVPKHPEVCQLAEAFVAELVGAPVEKRCDNPGTPHCSFVVLAPGTASGE